MEENSKMGDLVNKLFELNPNEEIIKALKGEIIIPAENVPNGLANLEKLISSMKFENKKH